MDQQFVLFTGIWERREPEDGVNVWGEWGRGGEEGSNRLLAMWLRWGKES